MSQLIDKLKRLSKSVPQPMGFRTYQPASSRPPMLLIAGLSKIEAIDSLADYVAGADAVLLNIAKSSRVAETIKDIAHSLSNIPWGVRLEEAGKQITGTMIDAGSDFTVFSASDPVSIVPQDEKIGRILQIEPSLNERLLKAANELSIDAVLTVNEPDTRLTWHYLMSIQRFADSLTKPLLVSIPSKLNADELKAIWEAGADGVIAGVTPEQPAGSVKELRQIINDLASLPQRKRRKTEAVIPHISKEADTFPDTEVEED